MDQYTTYRMQVVNQRQQTPQGQSIAKAGTPPVEYRSWECKRDKRESEGNMLNPIFNENVQGRKHTVAPFTNMV